MFGNLRQSSWYVGQLAGIPLFLHWSAIFLAFSATRRSDGMDGAILALISLLVGILLHELGHGLTARAFGAHGLTITVWAFGGLCESRRDNARLGREILIVAAGPAVSLLLWLGSWQLLRLLIEHQPGLVAGTMLGQFLAIFAAVQLMLLLFNLLPIYPLDGGQLTYYGALGVTRDQLLARQIALFLAVIGSLAWFAWATGLVDAYRTGHRDPFGYWLQLVAHDPVHVLIIGLFLALLLRDAFLHLR